MKLRRFGLKRMNMAGPSSQYNIQDIVRAVVDNFNRLPRRSSTDATETSSTTPTVSSTAVTPTGELNCCFQIPRGSQSFQPSPRAESQANPQTTVSQNNVNRCPQIAQSSHSQVPSQPNLQPSNLCSLSSGSS